MKNLKIDFIPHVFSTAFPSLFKAAIERENNQARESAYIKEVNGTFDTNFTTIEDAEAFMDEKNSKCSETPSDIVGLLKLATK